MEVTIDSILKEILLASRLTEDKISFELSIDTDESCSMYGEYVYYVLRNGDVDYTTYDIKSAYLYLANMENTYVI